MVHIQLLDHFLWSVLGNLEGNLSLVVLNDMKALVQSKPIIYSLSHIIHLIGNNTIIHDHVVYVNRR